MPKNAARKAASSLFMKLGDSINTLAQKIRWANADGNMLRSVIVSNSESGHEDEPWRDIFYIRFYFFNEELPTPVGVGSVSMNQIWLNRNLVPRKFWALLRDVFGFSLILVDERVEEIKKSCGLTGAS